jgi:hypothetical protein
MAILGSNIATYAVYPAAESVKPWEPRAAALAAGEGRG